MIENQIYVCSACGEYALLASFYLKTCPKRPIDDSYIVDEDIKNLKINLTTNDPIIIKRKHGYEKQLRLNCPNCDIWIAYHQFGRYLYVLNDSLVRYRK